MPSLLTDLPVPPGPDALSVLPALERALAGGAPVRPVGPDATPEPAPDGAPLPEDLAVVVSTSGSTGSPKLTMLGADALIASATATEDRLGGAGQWLLALPAHHVGGLQVLLRSVHAGTTPVAVAPGASPMELVEAVASMTGPRRYTSMVPTQVVRLLDDPLGAQVLARLDAVLVGGAATRPDLLERARAVGATIVPTYGMSETAGGCVYAGRPLRDVEVRLEADGRIQLGGPTVAHGYLGRPGLTAEVFATDAGGTRWFRTDDSGHVDESGRLHVHGRIDDLINTGGLKAAPRLVEEAAVAHVPVVLEAVAVGAPDPRWGEAVCLAVVTRPDGPPPGPVQDAALADLRDRLRPHLPAHALPHRALVLDELPLRGPGKPDRRALVARFTQPT